VLAPGESFRFDDEAAGRLPGGHRAGDADRRRRRGARPAGAGPAPGRYPYGCTEQIASSLQPLLLAPDGRWPSSACMSEAEAARARPGGRSTASSRARGAAAASACGAGGFDLWLDAYVTDVLLRAEARARACPPRRCAWRSTTCATDGPGGVAARRRGRVRLRLLRAGARRRGRHRRPALLRRHPGRALRHAPGGGAARRRAGGLRRARARRGDVRPGARPGPRRRRRRRLAQRLRHALRDRAGLLALAVEAGSGVVDRLQLAACSRGAPRMHHLSTQEAAWALRAAVALGAEGQGLIARRPPGRGQRRAGYDGTPGARRNDGDADVA
jgi:alpha-2-macroglobulin